MIIWLTLLSCLAAVLFLVVLAVFVTRITRTLERIGGADSLLAKIMYGVRAIETETGQIPAQVIKLNGSLNAAAGGLSAIDATLVRIIEAASRQGQKP